MVSLILISHSPKIVEGIKDMLDEMAKGIPLFVAGGNNAGGLGSDYELIKDAMHKAHSPDGVIILFDLGSSFMTADTVLDEMDDAMKSNFVVSRAPLVEGAIAAAIEISFGANLEDVQATLKEMEMMK
ncbi:MAG: PTS-dependent dihydroxyacetone kinase phosphotransferase subunit DhaM [Clostridiales bacterium]|jgi:dihydroxyacetone kinase phosphotransfer subunit|nr:PTS-dependent dihydroxyacetone kinase phosphotransferase subunit DhaM [Clostridiales bacterium]